MPWHITSWASAAAGGGGDGRWAAVFLANFHFISTGTNYLASQQPPSPLQNFWSLAVEEQFYVLYPTFFLLLAAAKGLTFRARMAIGLVGRQFVPPLAYSIADPTTIQPPHSFRPLLGHGNSRWARSSPLTTPSLLKLPEHLAAIATWLGVGADTFAAVVFTSQDAYSGLAGNHCRCRRGADHRWRYGAAAFGAEVFLRFSPVRWIGKLSYSLYLWRWPILIVAAEYAGKTTLSVRDNLGWDVVALLASVVTYFLIEKPIRHSRASSCQPMASVRLGVLLVGMTLGAITVISNHSVGSGTAVGRGEDRAASSVQGVLRAVAKSDQIQVLPSNLKPSLAGVLSDPRRYIGYPPENSGCVLSIPQASVPTCTFGDGKASHTMVLYGDSHRGNVVPGHEPNCEKSTLEACDPFQRWLSSLGPPDASTKYPNGRLARV